MSINETVQRFFRNLPNPIEVNESMKLVDILDSLGFLDFFMFLEQSLPDMVSLDDVAHCATVGDLSQALDAAAPSQVSL